MLIFQDLIKKIFILNVIKEQLQLKLKVKNAMMKTKNIFVMKENIENLKDLSILEILMKITLKLTLKMEHYI